LYPKQYARTVALVTDLGNRISGAPISYALSNACALHAAPAQQACDARTGIMDRIVELITA
jgi:hypothetical protein